VKRGKQRRDELRVGGAKRDAKRRRTAAGAEASRIPAAAVAVNRELLAPSNSYGEPAFARRGYYVDTPFRCATCGVEQVWTATQQKWWYEVAKGFVYSIAKQCRACRRRRRERSAASRQVHLEGVARKRDDAAGARRSR
jgi:hypothetical protein